MAWLCACRLEDVVWCCTHSLMESVVDREYGGRNAPEGKREGGTDAFGAGACNFMPDSLLLLSSYDRFLLRSVPREPPSRGQFCRRRAVLSWYDCFSLPRKQTRQKRQEIEPFTLVWLGPVSYNSCIVHFCMCSCGFTRPDHRLVAFIDSVCSVLFVIYFYFLVLVFFLEMSLHIGRSTPCIFFFFLCKGSL